jgi:GH43 family beta-xylosidase
MNAMKLRLSLLVLLTQCCLFSGISQVPSSGLKLCYDFSGVSGTTVSDVSGNGYNATLSGSATVGQAGSYNILKLGTSNGYLDMGSSVGNLISTLTDFTISTYLYIPTTSTITGNGNFAWTFSTSNACTQTVGKYVAYRVNLQRYAQSSAGWGGEANVLQVGSALGQGFWHHLVFTLSGTTGTLYVDGQAAKTGTISLTPSAIGATTYNWLGKPQFSGDSYLKDASYADFRIYNRALSTTEVTTFVAGISDLNSTFDLETVNSAKSALALPNTAAVRNNLTLPVTASGGVSISWSSSNTSVVSSTGVVVRPESGQDTAKLTLTATLSKGLSSSTKSFSIAVIPQFDEFGSVAYDSASLYVNTAKCYFLGKIPLKVIGDEGSSIQWTSSNTAILTNSGDIVKLPAKGQGNLQVALTATLSKGDAVATKVFDVCIHEDEGYEGYLWVYFTGNTPDTQENIFYALSSDGFNFKTLNSGNYILVSDTISNMDGVRDPHIMRGPDGKYYMVATDMRAARGWESNHGIVLMKSDDLISWKHTAIDIKALYASFSTITRAWAPETIYDEKTGKFMIYFSMKSSVSGSHDIIYYAYANADFTGLESAPKVLFDNGVSTIDGNIVYRDGVYNLFFKTEDAADKGYKKAISTSLTGGYKLIDKYLDQSSVAVEGGCVFKLNNQEKYVLMYDLYTTGAYEFTVSDSLENFRIVNTASRDFAPRHGTIMGITRAEAEKLARKWGSSSLVAFGTALSPQVKPINLEVNETTGAVLIPVSQGTDLTTFNPQISGTVTGVGVSPSGVQDFSLGSVPYTLSLNGTTKNYSISVATYNNPIISGYYADPEILYSEKTRKFYLYPTTDGFYSWGGYYFKVFSSSDLVHWSDEGVLLDMHDATQISWANGNAWAPCIVEKKINDSYKYVFYFSGGVSGGTKQIGYAVSDNPNGPFTVSASPLITSSPTGSGQQIDPDVFTDPVSGNSYLYWGNGYMAVAQLNDDLQSLKTSPSVITPTNYTEGTHVFYRNGKYYFTWSSGNTSNATYCVYYGYSTSPTGPITIPASNNILSQSTSSAIYGPGHNSVIQIPGRDEWYIVYHRISRPNGLSNTSLGAGNVRELCMDKLEFNSDGTIKTVVPTLQGIQPVVLYTHYLSDGLYFVTASNGGTTLYLTDVNRTMPANGSSVGCKYMPRNATDSLAYQAFQLTFDASVGRYKMEGKYRLDNPAVYKHSTSGTAQSYVNEKGAFGGNVYYKEWNTMTLTYDGSRYSIQNGGSAGTQYWIPSTFTAGASTLLNSNSLAANTVYNFVPANIVTDITNLKASINTVTATHTGASEGEASGQFRSANRTVLQNALSTANAPLRSYTSTQPDVRNAKSGIESAKTTFLASINQTFAGTGSWSEPAKWSAGFAPATTANVYVAAAGDLTIDANSTVNSLSVGPSGKLTLPSGKSLTASNLVLNSDMSGSATYVDNGTTTVSSALVQQYLASARNWYVSAPVSGATVPDGVTYFGYSEPGSNSDLSVSGSSSFWKPYAPGSNIVVGKGYIVQAGNASTLQFSGNLNTGDVTVPLTRTLGKAKEGFNLIGNPYPSYVSMKSLSATDSSNLQTTYWIRSKTADGTSYVFDTYNFKGNLAVNVGSGKSLTGVLAPFQSFWVRVREGHTTGNVTFHNSFRSHIDESNNQFRAQTDLTQSLVRLQVSNGTNADETLLYSDPNASSNLDDYDSQKMSNAPSTLPELYTLLGNEKLAINGMRTLINTQIPLGFSTTQSGTFTLRATETRNLDEGTSIVLEDNLDLVKPIRTELSNGTVYAFTSEAITTQSRFKIWITNSAIPSGLPTARQESFGCYVKEGRIVVVDQQGQKPGTIELYRSDGKKLMHVDARSTVTELPLQVSTGVYFLKVIHSKTAYMQKLAVQ